MNGNCIRSDTNRKRIQAMAKGNRNQKRTECWLRAYGFEVETAKRSTYKGNNDFFTRWNHIAIAKPERPTDTTGFLDIYIPDGETLYVQTKSNALPSPQERSRLAEFPAPYKILFIWYDRQPNPRLVWLTSADIIHNNIN